MDTNIDKKKVTAANACENSHCQCNKKGSCQDPCLNEIGQMNIREYFTKLDPGNMPGLNSGRKIFIEKFLSVFTQDEDLFFLHELVECNMGYPGSNDLLQNPNDIYFTFWNCFNETFKEIYKNLIQGNDQADRTGR